MMLTDFYFKPRRCKYQLIIFYFRQKHISDYFKTMHMNDIPVCWTCVLDKVLLKISPYLC